MLLMRCVNKMLIKVFLFDINREINKLNGVLQSLHSALADCQGFVFIVVFSLAAVKNILMKPSLINGMV